MIWGVIAVIGALVGAFLYWRRKRRQRTRLISFVALVREPVTFDPAVLARVAGKTWNADLGDGSSQGADGFVVGIGVMNTIMHEGRMFLVNSLPTPYVTDVEKAAAGFTDLRTRDLFLQHRAWFSCDAMGVDGTTAEEEVLDWYQRLGKLFANLLDENCLLVYMPDSRLTYPINKETEKALCSQDPVRSLEETWTLPIVEVSADDPRMKQAVERARATWPEFLAAYEAKAGEHFAVKAPVTHGGNTEFIWILVTALEGDHVYGELANDPGNLGSLKLGSKVSVAVADLNDWAYIDRQGKPVGGFTIEAVLKLPDRRPG